MENKELTFKQEKAAHYIVGGVSLKDTADYVGVSSQTLFRWLKLPAMQTLTRELRRITLEHSINELQRLNSKAISALEDLLSSPNPAARCRAASIVLTKNHEFLDYYDYDTRLKIIEQRFNEKE
jgi:hypothetical protein